MIEFAIHLGVSALLLMLVAIGCSGPPARTDRTIVPPPAAQQEVFIPPKLHLEPLTNMVRQRSTVSLRQPAVAEICQVLVGVHPLSNPGDGRVQRDALAVEFRRRQLHGLFRRSSTLVGVRLQGGMGL